MFSSIMMECKNTLSPLDGRYSDDTKELLKYFSESSFVYSRTKVEVEYFKFLCIFLNELKDCPYDDFQISYSQHKLYNDFKDFEVTLKHDVKSIEYLTKEMLTIYLEKKNIEYANICKYIQFIHFGLTSEDINSTSLMLSIKQCSSLMLSKVNNIVNILSKFSDMCNMPILGLTHGQPATPLLFSEVFETYKYRLNNFLTIDDNRYSCKFGGAVGSMNAHQVAYPNINWKNKLDEFVNNLGLIREQHTTQISNNDNLAFIFNHMKQICIILKDMCIDIWLYISKNYLVQQKSENEIGSSTMPHKINPINFENAEGNFEMAIVLFDFLSNKLPVSRLQRDLSGSTVSRNIGVAFGHMLVAIKSLCKGIQTIKPNNELISNDLSNNCQVVTEAYQTILRREGYTEPYELLKKLTTKTVSKNVLEDFVNDLDISDTVKEELLKITPFNYACVNI